MSTWREIEPQDVVRIGALGYVLVSVRGVAFGAVTYGGLAALMLVRLFERPLFGLQRPVSPHITTAVCRTAFLILGIRYRVKGRPMKHRGAIVSNHASWLDIFALNACQTVYFVSKAEVAKWPLVGWLARATGTEFIARNPKAAKEQQAQFEARLRAGHKLLFFPEGTSTDGLRVLTFKSTLFGPFFTHGLDDIMKIQPVSIVYSPPPGRGERFYGWWGDMDFATHLIKVLAQFRQGAIEVIFHEPVAVDEFESRKTLAQHCEDAVRGSVKDTLGTRFQG